MNHQDNGECMQDGSNGSDGDSKCNLIVNYLPQMLTDQEFRQMFLEIGSIKNSKIIRDKATGYSYGFGFVEFNTAELAIQAIENLNGVQLQNKTIKVAYARPPGEESKGTNIYIQNLPKSMIKEELATHFNAFGNIIQCKILSDHNTGESKGVGFVLFENKQMAQKALDEMNGKVLMGGTEPLNIKFAAENSKKVRPPAGGSFYPPPPLPPPSPRGFFGGPMRSQPNRYPNRFNPMMGGGQGQGGFGHDNCYNNFQSAGRATAPVVGPADGGGYILYVNNLGQYIQERTIWSLFSNYGPVLRVNIMRDHQKDDICKNYGFVTMANYDDAANAIVALNGIYRLTNKPLNVSFKTPKNC